MVNDYVAACIYSSMSKVFNQQLLCASLFHELPCDDDDDDEKESPIYFDFTVLDIIQQYQIK